MIFKLDNTFIPTLIKHKFIPSPLDFFFFFLSIFFIRVQIDTTQKEIKKVNKGGWGDGEERKEERREGAFS